MEAVAFNNQSGNLGGFRNWTSYIPIEISKIETIEFFYNLSVSSYANGETSNAGAKIEFKVLSFEPISNTTQTIYSYNDQLWAPQIGTKEKLVSTGGINIESSKKIYKIEITLSNYGANGWGSRNNGSVSYVKIRYSDTD